MPSVYKQAKLYFSERERFRDQNASLCKGSLWETKEKRENVRTLIEKESNQKITTVITLGKGEGLDATEITNCKPYDTKRRRYNALLSPLRVISCTVFLVMESDLLASGQKSSFLDDIVLFWARLFVISLIKRKEFSIQNRFTINWPPLHFRWGNLEER